MLANILGWLALTIVGAVVVTFYFEVVHNAPEPIKVTEENDE